MSKLDISPDEVDRIFDAAIESIGTGEEQFSCLALYFRNRSVTDLYERIFTYRLRPAPSATPRSDRLLYNVMRFASDRKCWKNWDMDTTLTLDKAEVARDLRIVMLSLARVAWRDWV